MECIVIITFDFRRISIASWMFLGVLLLIFTTLSSFSRPALMAGPPDTTCDWIMEQILASDWLSWPGTQTARCLLWRICHQLWRPQRVQIPGDLDWNKSESVIMINCFLCFLNSPDFNVQSLHLKIVSFLLADFQDSVLRIYRQKLHESFLLLPFSPFSPW